MHRFSQKINQNAYRILWAAILVYLIFFGIFTALRHYNFQTQAWDMGVFVQTFWHTINGRPMFNNLEEIHGPWNHLAVHMRPFMLAIAPFYALFPSPYTLLIVQTIALALGAWPLYLLAVKILQNKKLALGIALAYLLYPSLHWVNIFDFHEVPFLIPFFITAFYFWEAGRYGWASAFFALGASTKEDAILVVLFAGIYLLVRRQTENRIWWTKERKVAAVLVLLLTSYFLLSTKVIMPSLGGGLLRLDRYEYIGGSPETIIKNFISAPLEFIRKIWHVEKLSYLFWLFLPLAFLPLFSDWVLLLLIPGLLENLLTDFGSQFSSFYQYDSVLIGPLFVAAIFGIKKILGAAPKYSGRIFKIFILTALIGYFFRSPVNPIFFPLKLFQSDPHWESLRQIVKMIPDKVSVAAQTNLVPHLSHREYAYNLGYEPYAMDVVIIDAADLSGFPNGEKFQAYVDQYVNSGEYNILPLKKRYLIIFKKGIQLLNPENKKFP